MEGNGLRPEQRIVVKMPLVELWDDAGSIAGARVRYLDRDQIAELLRTTPVHFVVADCGLRLRRAHTKKKNLTRVREQGDRVSITCSSSSGSSPLVFGFGLAVENPLRS
jgi:hypothetical protein